MNNNLELEVFKTGDYGTKGQWGEAELDGLAADYDPTLHEAPVTVDHAQTGPALGWVESLRRVGDRLVARLRGVSARLVELIRAGAFKKRSVEIYPTLRESGRPYLRAVSFLGAASPEVKGLADPEIAGETPRAAEGLFGEEEGGHVAFEMEATGSEQEHRSENENDKSGDYENEHEHEGRHEDVHEHEGRHEDDEQGKEVVAFAELRERLQAGGRWRPGWGDRGIAEFWRALAAVDEIAINANENINAAEWFARFLEELPPVVAMGEAAPAGAAGMAMTMTAGGNVDPESVALHRRAVCFMDENPGVGYGDALVRCAR